MNLIYLTQLLYYQHYDIPYRSLYKINDKGAKIVVSNSDPKNTDENDDFFDEIYSSHSIKRVDASRMINSNGAKRGKIKELLISNF